MAYNSKIMKTIYNYIVIIILAVISIGCTTTRYVEVTNTDTVHHFTQQRDSIMLFDSVFVDRYINGDTVKITKEVYKLRYKDRFVTDTLYINKEIKVPYPVEKELTTWQKIQINTGEIFLCLFALSLVVIAILWIIPSHKKNR